MSKSLISPYLLQLFYTNNSDFLMLADISFDKLAYLTTFHTKNTIS